MKQEINNFMETDSESVYQAWERLVAMLRKCPHHVIQDPDILYIFYHGLKPSARNVIDAASGGSIMGETIVEAMQLLNEISESVVQWPSDRMIIKKTTGVNQVEALNLLTQQIATLTQKVEAFQVGAHTLSQLENCDVCQVPWHKTIQDFNGVIVMVLKILKDFYNQKRQVQGPPGFQNQNIGQQRFQQYQQQPQRAHQQSLEDLMYKFIKATDEKVESQHSAIKNLEIQVSQLGTLMSGQIQGALPSNTEKNPKEHLKAISLRSGKSLDDPYADREGKPQEVEKVNEGENKIESKFLKEQKDKSKNVLENELITNPHSVPLPFPQKMKRENLDKQFSKFLDILKQIYINIPFTDAFTQMPSYDKFLKEILSSKRKLEEVLVVKLTEKCSATLQNKLPLKLGDPGSFTVSCTVGGIHFEKALCDSGASINLMPFLIFRKLELGEMKDTRVSLQLADQSTKRPKGIIENILVRIDKFVFPVDFIVLEMEENTEVPLILGRPLLARVRAIIVVHQGQLILRVDEERVIFDMQKIMKFHGNESSSSCFQIDLLDDLVDEYKNNQLIIDSLERCLARSGIVSDDNPVIREQAEILEKESENEKVSEERVQLKIELKELPSHLKYVFLEPELFPVIISSSLTIEQESKLIGVLRKHKTALGWTIADIKGISPAICIYRILMENDYMPIVQPQRRLNPTMQEVVKKEVVKLLLVGIIYPISDSPWIPISLEDQEKTTFTCPQGTYSYRRMPFGLCNAPATFQHCKSAIFSDMAEKSLEIFMDDFTLFDDCRKAFKILKKHLTNAPTVVFPNWSEPFEIMCDASDIAVRAILGQKRFKIFRPIYYASRTLKKSSKELCCN
ncbi:uncharacterized protein [Nicotiana sylvestris]|uniref:uncharacterized protein n=1 Tax=Nicotiana sylvestris TaxID=4096 RepID=UPI00388C55CE